MTDTIDITAVSKLKHSELWEASKKYGSQSALAKFLGVNENVMCGWINLKSVPGPRLITERGDELDAKLTIATGKGLDELFPEALRQAKEFLAARDKTIEQRATLSRQALEYYARETTSRLEYTFPDIDSCQLQDDVSSLLEELTAREEHALTIRFGLDGNGTRSYREMAKEMGCSIERCRQIEDKAIRKMQQPNRSKKLVGYLPE